MNIVKQEIKLANGFNQFNLTNENNLLVGVVAGFSNEQNKKTATLFENSPKMLEVLRELMRVYEQKGQLLNFDVNLVREVLNNIDSNE